MNVMTRRSEPSRPSGQTVLVLQGGGALGAYQAGVYQGLSEAGIEPDWVIGTSIGAINAAIIAGNKPADRLDRLKDFWDRVQTRSSLKMPWLSMFGNAFANLGVLTQGVPGFFQPNPAALWGMHYPAGPGLAAYYGTDPLKSTLADLIDVERLNSQDMRATVGAVNVGTGEMRYFDNRDMRLDIAHVMASGALPPAFPAIEIEGEQYWDGGLVSNTPLDWVVESQPHFDTLAFQVDLWSARGELPSTLVEVSTRQKEIQYSSRTRASTNSFRRIQRLRRIMADLLDKLPEELGRSSEAVQLRKVADRKVYNIVHLNYHPKNYEGNAKDYEFSRRSMEDHWRAGYYDAVRTLRHPEVLEQPANQEGVFTFDLAVDGRE